MKNFLLILFGLFIIACGTNSNPTQKESPPKPELTEAEADELLLQLSTHLIADPQTLAQKDNNTIVNYAIDNNHAVEITNSGLYYEIIKEGTGENVKWGDRIAAHYKGYFLDGNIFDSSYRKNKPLEFYVGNTIAGWNEGLQKAKVGSKIRLLIPSHLAYGEKEIKDNKENVIVPANAILAFEIEILEMLQKTTNK